ncbi:hypothetical protein CLOM_g10873 [Closterium sp. NIES-68]|nr:hypothetical protein CLOM_g9110 [Closterium sp. NIES-68]GJP50444.1 hypothetical protein CLOM_g9582 [Closterium sp. NIES-68]GJP51726.1 hypothetical protein CLOM_g10873 [Closterium sp. NIES-68]GJP74835.1 hypothetical protein CLOP_g5365 [Closterium sp. NIES-67]
MAVSDRIALLQWRLLVSLASSTAVADSPTFSEALSFWESRAAWLQSGGQASLAPRAPWLAADEDSSEVSRVEEAAEDFPKKIDKSSECSSDASMTSTADSSSISVVRCRINILNYDAVAAASSTCSSGYRGDCDNDYSDSLSSSAVADAAGIAAALLAAADAAAAAAAAVAADTAAAAASAAAHAAASAAAVTVVAMPAAAVTEVAMPAAAVIEVAVPAAAVTEIAVPAAVEESAAATKKRITRLSAASLRLLPSRIPKCGSTRTAAVKATLDADKRQRGRAGGVECGARKGSARVPRVTAVRPSLRP